MKMKTAACGIIVALVGSTLWVSAQEAAPALADVARNARKEKASATHVPASHHTDDDQDGPDSGGVWRIRLCSAQACYTLSVSLPRSPRWIRPAAEPRPVLIPLAGHEDELSHAIRVYGAESLPTNVGTVDAAKKTLLQAWFSRPEYFGQPARLSTDERLPSETGEAKISHFAVGSSSAKFLGVSVIEGSPLGFHGFACVFQEEDAGAASSVCDAIVRSARAQTFLTAYKRVYPTDDNPPSYRPPGEDPPDDSPDDPPETEDPE